jgi:hypothetical protein
MNNRMRQKKHLTALLILLAPLGIWAQTGHNYSVSGTVKDQSSGETMAGASVGLLEKPGIGVTTNSYGFYSLTLPEGHYHLIVSYSSYALDTVDLVLDKNMVRNVNLSSGRGQMQEAVVSGVRKNNITKTLPGVQRLTAEEIKNVPVVFGERDILKTIQLLPGIESAGDGKSGFYVRGGGTDQNLILLDEATVYNASHVLGFFSVFNSDALKDITVYKGGMPASYGGRLSSVEDITMRDGNNQKYVVSGGLGLIASRLNVEGPIVKDKGSFFVSARRTYADAFLGLSSDTTIKGSQLYFYDVNAKANYTFDEHNKLYLSAYFGNDELKLPYKFGNNFGNVTTTLRWNHIFNDKLFSNTSLIYSNFYYNIAILNSSNNISIDSKVTDFHLKEDFNYYLNSRSKLDIGIDVIHHVLAPGVGTTTPGSSYNSLALQQKYAIESAAYASHEWTLSRDWKITYGVRLTSFTLVGPGNFYTYDNAGNAKDTTHYNEGAIVKTYVNPEPRFAATYQLDAASSIKFSYTRNVQNIHLLGNTTSSLPNSLFIPSSNNVKPEIADQFATGYYLNFHHNMYELSSEVYYKALQNQIDYKDGAELLGNEQIESQLLYGKGRAYGWENFVKKKYGKLTGWLSYTLSRTERKIPGINQDKYYPAVQDETHNLSVVGMYQYNKKWTFSATFVYNTGNATTWPSGKFPVNGAPVYIYSQRDGYRTPAYNRLDLGATLLAKKTAKFEGSWTFSIYNAYDRWNPYAILFQKDPNNNLKTQAVQTTLFGIVPSITYNFKF